MNYTYDITNMDSLMEHFEDSGYFKLELVRELKPELEEQVKKSIIKEVKQFIEKYNINIKDGDNVEIGIDINIGEDYIKNRTLFVTLYSVKDDKDYIVITVNQEVNRYDNI